MYKQIIFEKRRDLRLVTIRRDGTLNDSVHRLIAMRAADCAQHVLHLFEEETPDDDRPRIAIEQARAWARGEITTGQAVAVAHMAAHELGASAYGIRAVRAASSEDRRDVAGCSEFRWQHTQLPREIRDLV